MNSVDLPGVPIPLSQIALGTMTFGDTVESDEAAAMVDAALDAGITAIDTANGYASGRSESMLGELLAGRREQVMLATKVGTWPGDAGGHPPLSPEAIARSIRGSLRRLRVDHVDVYYLHQPDRTVPLADTLGAMGDLIGDGLVRAIGVSNYSAWQISEINSTCTDIGVPVPVVAQQLYNLIARKLEDEYSEFAVDSGLATIVYNPLAGGLLTGRYRFDAPASPGRFGSSSLSTMYRERYWNETVFDAISAFARIAKEAGMSMVELAIRWLISRQVVSGLLIGGSNVGQLTSNIAAVSAGPLDPGVIDLCDEVGATLAGPMPAYNR